MSPGLGPAELLRNCLLDWAPSGANKKLPPGLGPGSFLKKLQWGPVFLCQIEYGCGGEHGELLLGPRAGEAAAADPGGAGDGQPGPGGGARARLRRVEILVDVEGVRVGGGRGEGGVRILVLVVQVEVELLEGLVHDAPGLGLAALVTLGQGPAEAGQGQQEAGGGHGVVRCWGRG